MQSAGLWRWLVLAGLWGCDPTPSETVQPLDASARDTGTSSPDATSVDASADAVSACNDLTIVGVSPSTLVSTPEPAPAPTGGSIADGDYSLFETRVFGVVATPPKPWTTQRVRIRGDQVQIASNSSADPSDLSQVRTYSEVWDVGERTLSTRGTCPTESASQARTFSVLVDGGETYLDVFSMQSSGIMTRQRFRQK